LYDPLPTDRRDLVLAMSPIDEACADHVRGRAGDVDVGHHGVRPVSQADPSAAIAWVG
jgi:hypothetical protein